MKKVIFILFLAIGSFFLIINFITYAKVDNQEELSEGIFAFQKRMVENHDNPYTLEVKITFYGREKSSDIWKAYVYQTVDLKNKFGESIGGSNLPVVYYLKYEKNRYVVYSVEEPSDGRAYEESLNQLFPKKIVHRLNSILGFFSFRNKEYFFQKL